MWLLENLKLYIGSLFVSTGHHESREFLPYLDSPVNGLGSRHSSHQRPNILIYPSDCCCGHDGP